MMEGLREALQYVVGLKVDGMDPKIVEIDGKTYCDKDLRRYHSFDMADEIVANTLTAVVDYIKGRFHRCGKCRCCPRSDCRPRT